MTETMTKADAIRSMSDEGLARWIYSICTMKSPIRHDVIKWLQEDLLENNEYLFIIEGFTKEVGNDKSRIHKENCSNSSESD